MRKETNMTDYITWLKARIVEAETSGELWMLDPSAIRRAWEARQG